MKYSLLIWMVFLTFLSYSNQLDSLKIVALTNELELIEKDLNSHKETTASILNALYFTIGTAITIFLGVNIWNSLLNIRRVKKELINEMENELKRIDTRFTEKLNKIPSGIWDALEPSNKIRAQEISKLKLHLISEKSKYIHYENQTNEADIAEKFISEAIDIHEYTGFNDYAVKQGLIGLIEMLENGEFFHHTQADSLIKKLESDNLKSFKSYTLRAIELLRKQVK